MFVDQSEASSVLTRTLKSDKEAISSSSSLVAQEAEILACCWEGVSKSLWRAGGLENTNYRVIYNYVQTLKL